MRCNRKTHCAVQGPTDRGVCMSLQGIHEWHILDSLYSEQVIISAETTLVAVGNHDPSLQNEWPLRFTELADWLHGD